MVCRTCGRIIANENANFCEYCGAATDANRDGAMNYNRYADGGTDGASHNTVSGGTEYANRAEREDASYDAGQQGGFGYGQTQSGTAGLSAILNGTAGTAETESSMSFIHWIVIMVLPYIPMIGTLAYLVLLLIWAFGRTASKTRRSWARATLVITVVAMVMMSYMLQSVLGSGGFAELLNSMLGA